MEIADWICIRAGLSKNPVSRVMDLKSQGCTIPFIARYRQREIGNLQEKDLFLIETLQEEFEKLEKKRLLILEKLKSITTDSGILKKIENAMTQEELEELYSPFKTSKSSLVLQAKEAGLEEIAKGFLVWKKEEPSLKTLCKNPNIGSMDRLLDQVLALIAYFFSSDSDIKKRVLQLYEKYSRIYTSLTDQKDESGVYRDFENFSCKTLEITPHRWLAICRGEEKGFLKLAIDFPFDPQDRFLQISRIQDGLFYKSVVHKAWKNALSKSILPSVKRSLKNHLNEVAKNRSMEIFASNLRGLLMQSPVGKMTILGLDPGFRSGCKLAVVDPTSKPLHVGVIHPFEQKKKAAREIVELVKKYQVGLIVIGNGTASRETERFICDLGLSCGWSIVSEAGASVWSASPQAVEEFPDLDPLMRSAISIARRIQDPLAELVKIPPESIGVGMYQHDLDVSKLKKRLEQEVLSVVNHVGVDVNTASYFLLRHVSGLNEKTARNLCNHRDQNGMYKSRQEILDVDGIGAKTWTQAVGFLRVNCSREDLDGTIVHPESYDKAKKILLALKIDSISEAIVKRQAENIDIPLLARQTKLDETDIKELCTMMFRRLPDPRTEKKKPVVRTNLPKLSDLKSGMKLEGIVTNPVDFGLFVDIGVGVDGLVHKSSLQKKSMQIHHFSPGTGIFVEIMEVDAQRKRISLEIISV